jgi:hypothetical protein
MRNYASSLIRSSRFVKVIIPQHPETPAKRVKLRSPKSVAIRTATESGLKGREIERVKGKYIKKNNAKLAPLSTKMRTNQNAI